jgi:hypothetical protein
MRPIYVEEYRRIIQTGEDTKGEKKFLLLTIQIRNNRYGK